ncbi:hypothetical protein KIM322_11720 [Lactobacillus xylocopicola]|uniref:Uncharacterized protein n=1 Tax=Lactobacillus xylocopicola TaxID=2976676 RepID=A0ABM8BHY8_9LACO|nr:hypothetical protein KIM322_11720 [Lactobacillus xylocopicola]
MFPGRSLSDKIFLSLLVLLQIKYVKKQAIFLRIRIAFFTEGRTIVFVYFEE